MPPFRRYLKGPKSNTGFRPRRKAFRSNRLAEPKAATEGNDVQAGTESAQEDNDQDLSESTEEDEIPTSAINPYNSLLQSLSTQTDTEQHRRKRQRLEKPRESVPSENDHQMLTPPQKDILNEPREDEDVDALEADDEIGSDSDSEQDVQDPLKKHLGIDDRELSQIIKHLRSKSAAPERIRFCSDWKTIASGPSVCGARRATFKTNSDVDYDSFKLKEKLQQRMKTLFPAGFGILANALASPILNLQDVLFCGRTYLNARTIQQVICVHALNYVLKTRDRVLKNTAKLAKVGDDGLSEHRDQGFTRPKVVMLLPTRQACYKIVDMIVSLYEPEQQENRKRFNESFSSKDDDISEDKPVDFRELFGGNDDDLFRIGIKFTRKTVKFFSQFFSSDIIFASPLGLRMAMNTKDSKEDFDFLSSIEILIIDQADALLQQNWEHVEYIMDHMNLQPKEHHGCDFSRVRNWYLDGNARYLRQTIVLSSFLTPELNQIYGQYMVNIEGSLKITPDVLEGSIVSLGLSIRQTFFRFDAMSPQKEPDARFKAFTTTILPNLIKFTKSRVQGSCGILIFIPSYMDFVRVRNFMASSTAAQDISFGTISEYTNSSDVARARSHFVSGRHSVLLYSGRAHHFRRYKLKGVKQVIMYSLPENPSFYVEVAGGFLARSVSERLTAPEDVNARSLFCKWDILRLERTVGSNRVPPMIKEKGGEVFDFV